MKILVVENSPERIEEALRQLAAHNVTVITNNLEFSQVVEDQHFIKKFDVILSNMYASVDLVDGEFDAEVIECFAGPNEIGLVVAILALSEGVPYVGVFAYDRGKKTILNMIAEHYNVINDFINPIKGLTVKKIKKTHFGVMEMSTEKNWAGVLSGLLATSAN